jgi:hydrogenase small subunit
VQITRRAFLKWVAASASALGLSKLDLLKLEEALASSTSPPVIWLQGSSCTGCTISLLNVTNPTIDDVLLNTISMKYHPNLSTAAGELAVSTIVDNSNIHNGQFILCIEGGIPTGASGNYCVIARRDGQNWSMLSAINDLGPKARFVIAVGTCAAYGGVVRPSGHTGIRSVRDILAGKTRNTIINLPGCPTHPNTIVGTIVTLLTSGLPSLDDEGRPKAYYKDKIHEECPRKDAPEVKQVGVFGCYEDIDCRAKDTVSNCHIHKWNNGVNWCIGANMACIGCASKDFPKQPLYKYKDD